LQIDILLKISFARFLIILNADNHFQQLKDICEVVKPEEIILA